MLEPFKEVVEQLNYNISMQKTKVYITTPEFE